MEKQMNLIERYDRWMRNSGKRESTILTWHSRVNTIRRWVLIEYGVDIFDENSVRKCTPAMMDAWYNEVAIGNTLETRRGYVLALQKYFKYLENFKVITKEMNPTDALPKLSHEPVAPDISPDKIYSPEEIKIMLTCNTHEHTRGNNDRFRAIVATLLGTGLRAFELCSITVGQIRNCQNSTIYVERKGGKVKPVIIGAATWPFIKKYYQDQRSNARDDAPFFVTETGKGFTNVGLNLFVTHKQIALGIAHPGVHNFRHTAISNVAQSGNSVAARDFAGHSSVTMTNRYMHTKEEARQNIVNDTEMSRIMNEISEGHVIAASSTPHPSAKVEKRYPTSIEELANWEDDDDDDEDDEVSEVPEIPDAPDQSNWWDELDDPSDLTEEDFDI